MNGDQPNLRSERSARPISCAKRDSWARLDAPTSQPNSIRPNFILDHNEEGGSDAETPSRRERSRLRHPDPNRDDLLARIRRLVAELAAAERTSVSSADAVEVTTSPAAKQPDRRLGRTRPSPTNARDVLRALPSLRTGDTRGVLFPSKRGDVK